MRAASLGRDDAGDRGAPPIRSDPAPHGWYFWPAGEYRRTGAASAHGFCAHPSWGAPCFTFKMKFSTWNGRRCVFSGVRREHTRYAEIRCCSVFTAGNWCRRVSGRPEWRSLANSGSDCGSCCGIRWSTKSSVVVDRSSRTAVPPVQGCLERAMVRRVTGRLIRLPASLRGVRIIHHGRE
jgi:hypothetical protein